MTMWMATGAPSSFQRSCGSLTCCIDKKSDMMARSIVSMVRASRLRASAIIVDTRLKVIISTGTAKGGNPVDLSVEGVVHGLV